MSVYESDVEICYHSKIVVKTGEIHSDLTPLQNDQHVGTMGCAATARPARVLDTKCRTPIDVCDGNILEPPVLS